ncbi:MAG: TusE/DsrC/DsvC family sulfur relay protein [bacterium]|nr:TusE/DsrC/DsvC family sulfur relay protein [bacterium]
MPEIEHNGITVEVDEIGFLANPASWTEAIAEVLAHSIGIDKLTKEHMSVINFIREHWLEFDVAPMIRVLCRETNMNLKQIYELFPDGPASGASKCAGLPMPEECV